MSAHVSKVKKRPPARAAGQKSRVEEIADFLEDVALNRKSATEEEVNNAMLEFSECLSHLSAD
jgi:hypothetical protein